MSAEKQYTYPSYSTSRNIVEIPVAALHELFIYDAETGLFTRKPRVASAQIGSGWSVDVWNRKWAGKPAFTVDNGSGYLVCAIDRKNYAAHRVAFAMHHGRWPSLHIDHINHDRKDNRIANLREASQAENCRNMSLSKANTSGVPGVRWDGTRWRVRIRANGRHLDLGVYTDFEAARAARKAAEAVHGYHPHHGKNNP
jgi:hypothetical protein